MAATPVNISLDPDVDPERVGSVWIDAERAMIARWRGEPVVERLESDVPPTRPGRGIRPARSSAPSRRRAHTRSRHGRAPRELLRGYFAVVAGRLADLDIVESPGVDSRMSSSPTCCADWRRVVDGDIEVTTRRTSRPPTERQLAARLWEMLGAQLPRETLGSFRWTGPQPTAASGGSCRQIAADYAPRRPVISRSVGRSNSRSS